MHVLAPLLLSDSLITETIYGVADAYFSVTATERVLLNDLDGSQTTMHVVTSAIRTEIRKEHVRQRADRPGVAFAFSPADARAYTAHACVSVRTRLVRVHGTSARATYSC